MFMMISLNLFSHTEIGESCSFKLQVFTAVNIKAWLKSVYTYINKTKKASHIFPQTL